MWDTRKAAILVRVRSKLEGHKSWRPDEFWDPLADLGDDLVSKPAYQDAVSAGRDAVPDAATDDGNKIFDGIVDTWVGHVRKYADAVGGRMADDLSEFMNEVAPDGTARTMDEILADVSAKLEALRSSVTRYAEPPWGAGMEGYGTELDTRGVKLIWVLDDSVEHCADCPALAAGGPYERGTLPTWPKAGETACRDRCYCTIQADPESWAAVFGG